MPARRASASRSRAGAPQLVVAGGPRRLDRDVDAAGLVRRAGHAGGELGDAVTGEHEVGVAVDEAGDHAAPVDVDALVARRRRRRCRRRRPRRRRSRRGRRPARRRSVFVTSSPMPSTTRWSRQHRRQLGRRRRWSRGGRRARRPGRRRRRGGRRPRSPRTRRSPSASSAPAPAVRTESRRIVVRSAGAPGRDAPGVGPAEAGVAVRRRHRQQRRRRRGAPACPTPGARRARRPGPPRAGR